MLNFNEQRSISRALFQADIPLFTEVVKFHGGCVTQDFRNHELKIIPDRGYVVIALKCDGEPIALCGLATERAAGLILYDELRHHHTSMLRGLEKCAHPELPQFPLGPLPWIHISLAPKYVNNASALELHQTMSAVWAVAFACLDQDVRSNSAPPKS